IEQEMVFLADGHRPKRRSDLGDLDKENWEHDDDEPKDPWQWTNYLVLRRVSDGAVFTFTTSTKGGIDAIAELSKEYGKAMRQRPDQDPVIELDVGSYLHRDRSIGRVKYPVLNKIVGWVPKDSGDGSGGDAPSEPPQLPPSSTAASSATAKK